MLACKTVFNALCTGRVSINTDIVNVFKMRRTVCGVLTAVNVYGVVTSRQYGDYPHLLTYEFDLYLEDN